MSFSVFDRECMARALQLARHGLYTTDPNPRVGCVIAREGVIIGEGFHARAGQPHAERHALALAAAGDARGATCYVTLEPCSHTGRTGPCADALIEAGVARVVVAMEDPNPLVAGQGLRRVQDAGIQVDVGLLEQDARALNPGFIRRMAGGRPWVRIKVAASLDGRTAMASGESQWITGPEAREDVQRLRARSSAIITGIGTVLADRPSYTVRPEQWTRDKYGEGPVRPPLRVILDPTLRTPTDSPVVTAAGPCLIAHADSLDAAALERRRALERAGSERLALPRALAADGSAQPGAPVQTPQHGLDLHALVAELARRECNEVLVECGATLAGAFVREGLFDELIVYLAPTLLGTDARGLLNLPLERMDQQVRLRWHDLRRVGADLRLTLVPA